MPIGLFFRSIATAGLAVLACTGAQAQSRLDAAYTAYLAGIPIGKGTWALEIDDTQYSSTISGGTIGLIKVFTGGQGSTVARGTFAAGQLASSTYSATIKTTKKVDQIDLNVAGGAVKDVHVDPPVDPDPERVPITDEMRRNVLDPITASFVRIAGNGELLTSEACQRSAAVFDGRMRYDLQLAFKRMDKVRSDKGYSGPVVVCSVLFTPLGGHIPSRATIKYMTEMREMEIWFAPVAGTRFLVPYRMQAPTPIGYARLEADDFVVVPLQARASSNKSTKTQ